ncbi:hypothetical protein, partial [Pantoea sp. Pa-EAmG]|uniref:hypothetical protein n=1 Tax=Pantoea sp. Pa-EAmG TaxID=3043311 RepID=UPI0024AF1B18
MECKLKTRLIVKSKLYKSQRFTDIYADVAIVILLRSRNHLRDENHTINEIFRACFTRCLLRSQFHLQFMTLFANPGASQVQNMTNRNRIGLTW